ncbi:hypothetical protein [Nocardia sp. NPDC002869]|uniref:hypothetical protein n=1 Tax=Nocardia sp. NPDC002869 TaxID=3161032 RepID=UPI00398CD21F
MVWARIVFSPRSSPRARGAHFLIRRSDHAAIAQANLNGSPVQAGYLMDEHISRDEELLADMDAEATPG